MASVRAAVGASLAVARTRPRCVGLALPSSAPRSAWAAAMEPTPRWLAGLRFDNRALRELPVETPPPGPEDSLATPRPVPGACFSRARPAPLRRPRLVALSEPALALLGLEASEEAEVEAEAALFFSGNALLPGTEPAAHCYCGHQFGQFAGQLGDGAAMYLGEVCTAAGERWELQLKGAGPTPFSRCGTPGELPGGDTLLRAWVKREGAQWRFRPGRDSPTSKLHEGLGPRWRKTKKLAGKGRVARTGLLSG